MSGGYFDYVQFKIKDVADELKEIIFNKEYSEKFSENTIDDFMVCYKSLRYAFAYLHRIDRLLSGDDGEESFYEGLDNAIDEVVRDLKSFEVKKIEDADKQGGIECIDAIKASMSGEEFRGYLKGNALKYLWRYQDKGNPAQDLAKAKWYLEKLEKEVGNAGETE